MLKSQLINKIATKIDLSEKAVELGINEILDSLADALAKGRRVEIRDFGCFYLRFRKSRNAHNPRTGEKVVTDPKHVIRFKAGKELRERVAESTDPIRED